MTSAGALGQNRSRGSPGGQSQSGHIYNILYKYELVIVPEMANEIEEPRV